MDLASSIRDAVSRYWADEVQIIDMWSDGPDVVCIVYRRTIDPALTLGTRAEFNDTAADGTIEGYALDIALNLAEPIGVLGAYARRDRRGILWVAVPHERPTPEPPPEIIKRWRGTTPP